MDLDSYLQICEEDIGIRPMNEIKENMKILIRDHILSFPAIESHCARKDSAKKYLSSDLNIANMFRLFKKKFPDSNVAERQYRDYFVSQFNINFHLPRKDQCDLCTAFKNRKDIDPNFTDNKYEKHLNDKNMARTQKEKMEKY